MIYSVWYYNGISGMDACVVRFISCVAIHAAWAGAAALVICRRRDYIRTATDFAECVVGLTPALAIPVFLHGLCDTLLKTDTAPWAVVIGIDSFACFLFLQERESHVQSQEVLRLAGVKMWLFRVFALFLARHPALDGRGS